MCVKAVGFEGLRSDRIKDFGSGGKGNRDTLTVHLNSKRLGFWREMVTWPLPGYPNVRVPHESRDVAFRIPTAATQTVLRRAAAACSSLPNSKWSEFRLFDTSIQFNGNAWRDALRGIWNLFFTSSSSFGKYSWWCELREREWISAGIHKFQVSRECNDYFSSPSSSMNNVICR